MADGGVSFKRGMATLLGGTALAQAIPLLAAPLLTRLYTPEQFGALAILLAVANPFSLLICGRYELTVVLPRDDARANTLARLALVLATIVSTILAVALLLFREPLAVWLGGGVALVPIALAPVLILMMGAFQPLNNWLIRKQAFGAMSVNKMTQTTGITLVSLALGWWAHAHGLMIGYIAGWAAYFAVGAMQARWKGFHFRPMAMADMRAAAAEYRSFPLYNALPAVLHTATLSIPVFLLSRVFDEEVTGQFNLCRQTIFLPVTFIATSFMQVYMQRASGTVAQGLAVMPTLLKGLRALAWPAIALVVVLVAGGPWLFTLVFGGPWAEAGAYARILALPIALQFVVMPLTPLLPALHRIGGYSVWQVAYFLAVLALGVAAYALPGHYLIALAAVESLCFIVLGAFILRSAMRHDAALQAHGV